MRPSQLIMLALIALASLTTVHAEPVNAPTDNESLCSGYGDAISALIEKFLEKLREHMKTGWPDIDLPVLDPLLVPSEKFNLKKVREYDLSGGISPSKLYNLSTFNVTSIKTSIFHMQANLTVTIPYLFLKGGYNLKGNALGFIPIRGTGPYTLRPSGITTSVYSVLHWSNSHVQMKSMDFDLAMTGLQANFEGLFGGGKFGNIVNSLMNRFGIALFRKIEPRVHEKIRVALLTEINQILKDMPLSQLTGLLASPYCSQSSPL